MADKSNIHGFYYDNQLQNEFLSVGLYPNTAPGSPNTENARGDVNVTAPTLRYCDVANDGREFSNTSVKYYSYDPWLPIPDPDEDNDPNVEYPYSKTPICKSIINEDFQVSISNSFTDFGGDAIGSLWNELKPLGPYASEIAKSLGIIAEKAKKMAEEKTEGTKESPKDTFLGWLGNTLENVSDIGDAASDVLNRSLVVQGTRFSYYSGTGIDFGNLGMKFTIFTGYVWDDAKKCYVCRTVYDQVAKISKYVIGDFVPVTEFPNSKDLKQNPESFFGRLTDERKRFVQEFASWQLPPAGYTTNMKDIDLVQKGTLRLKIGPYFSLDNLVISGAQYNYSKSMAKVPVYGSYTFAPLSCEVILNLKPATKYSSQSLHRFISGENTVKARGRIESKMRENINSIKDKINKGDI